MSNIEYTNLIDQPLVSVIVPVYNVEKYIGKCIDSLKKQTYKNFEVIIVDDGSLDTSISIAKEMIGNDQRFKFFTKTNGGLSSARNFGVTFSVGPIISFLDSDDYFDKEFLTIMVNRMLADGSDVVICSMNLVDETYEIIEKRGPTDNSVIPGVSAFENNILMKTISSGAQNKIYKRSLIVDFPYPEGLFYEDRATTYKMFLSSERVSLVSSPLFYYLQREGSIMNGVSDKKINDRFIVHASIEDYLSLKKIREKYFVQLCVCYLLNVVFSGAYQIAKFSIRFDDDVKLHRKQINYKYFNCKSLFLLFRQNPRKFIAILVYIISPAAFRNVVLKMGRSV